MRRLLAAALALIIACGSPALAATCTCNTGLTCNVQGAEADWNDNGAGADGGTCDAGADLADDLDIVDGGILSINATNTVNTVRVRLGGTMNCMHDTTARVITVDHTVAGPNGGGLSAWVWLQAGSATNCAGTNGTEGENLTWTFSGTIPTNGAKFFVGDGVLNQVNPTTDAVFNFRGLKRASTSIDNFGQGAVATDFVYCADLVGGVGTAVAGDTAAFTSGNLTDYWCKLVTVGAECTTACAGAACDVQISCNLSASNEYLSMTKVANNGGPARHATPDDANADGTGDNTYASPATGDALDIFLPAIIQGGGDFAVGGATPITAGASVVLSGAQANMRYVTMRNLTAGTSASSCTLAGACDGNPAVTIEETTCTATDGGCDFLDFHDWASSVLMERNASDRGDDSRPNYPIIGSHWYIHDPDPDVPGTCTCTGEGIGGGIAYTVDNGDDGTISGDRLTGLHFARLFNPALSVTGPQSPGAMPQWTNLRFTGTLVHDWPGHATYGGAAGDPSVIVDHGADVELNGLECWDTGKTGASVGCLALSPTANGITADTRTGIRATNVYAVNADLNVATNTGAATVNLGYAIADPYNVDSSVSVLSNSYIANNVGSATRAGAVYFSYLLNNGIEDDGALPCASVHRGMMIGPADAIGNVLAGGATLACATTGILYNAGGSDGNGYAARTRRIVSNVIAGMAPNAAASDNGISVDGAGVAINKDFDVYNNVIDITADNSAGGFYERCISYTNADAASTAKLTGFYNFCMNALGDKAITWNVANGTSTVDFGYNRFYRVGSAPYATGNEYVDGGLKTGDLMDNDQDFFRAPTGGLYTLSCGHAYRTGTSYGATLGPLRYGINTFEYFHPAAIATMNAGAFKARSDWQDCSSAYMDEIPR